MLYIPLSVVLNILQPIFVERTFNLNYRILENTFYFHGSKIARGHGFNFGYVDLIKDIITDSKDRIEGTVNITGGSIDSIDEDTMICQVTGYIKNVSNG